MASEPISARARLLALALAALAGTGCAHGLRRFPLAEPMTEDPDRQPFAPAPESYFSGFYGDGADQILFRPIARFFAVDPAGEAVNVNALDEVPDSSWYENRLGARELSPDDVGRGACTEPPLDPGQPWSVVGAKPNGANPGFIIEGNDGKRYLLKFDSLTQPQRATAADVIGSRLYWAAGFNAPCNRVVYFDARTLVIGEGATAEDASGREVPLTQRHIDTVLSLAGTEPDGRYRAAASLYLPGKPLGPFRYEDTRRDDPNDVVEHDDRRELRGAKLMAAWLNHFDAREQNTLDIWITTEGDRGYVRHYYLDFGDTLGSMWGIDWMSQRLGHSHYLDFNWIARDFFTFGTQRRPWELRRLPPERGTVFGYFDAEHFDPAAWKPGYPNPAFLRMSERDGAWMARKLARLTRDDIAAAVREGRLSEPSWEAWLIDTLEQRRLRILTRYLSRVSPLDRPALAADAEGTTLCLDDPLILSGARLHALRTYHARAWDADRGVELTPPRARHRLARGAGSPPAGVCVVLPEVPAGPAGERPTYVIVDITAVTHDDPEPSPPPTRAHLYRLRDGGWRLVGLQHPEGADAPHL
ncbi:MAG: hypothetical protein H6744_21290 [Deltaproteobacteria bacterium]|nr:hypothetical protein [Deltaproteobacteria bacterium]